jgi:LysM repeat protein
MSDSSPLIPRGSLLEQQSKSRPHLRIALCIVAGHLVFLGGLLMQGCKRDDPGEMATGTGLPTLELTNTVAPMPLDVVPVPRDTPRFPAPIEPELTPSLPVLPPARDLPPPQWEEATPPPPPPVRQELPPPVEPRSVTEHTVVQGDTFYGLAQRYGVTSGDIARANPGVDATRLQVGQKLTIPAASTAAPTVRPTGPTPGIHVVKRGDTLTRIAQQHGITVEALKAMNGLVTDRIIVDQKLSVPGPGGAAPRGN